MRNLCNCLLYVIWENVNNGQINTFESWVLSPKGGCIEQVWVFRTNDWGTQCPHHGFSCYTMFNAPYILMVNVQEDWRNKKSVESGPKHVKGMLFGKINPIKDMLLWKYCHSKGMLLWKYCHSKDMLLWKYCHFKDMLLWKYCYSKDMLLKILLL